MDAQWLDLNRLLIAGSLAGELLDARCWTLSLRRSSQSQAGHSLNGIRLIFASNYTNIGDLQYPSAKPVWHSK